MPGGKGPVAVSQLSSAAVERSGETQEQNYLAELDADQERYSEYRETPAAAQMLLFI